MLSHKLSEKTGVMGGSECFWGNEGLSICDKVEGLNELLSSLVSCGSGSWVLTEN